MFRLSIAAATLAYLVVAADLSRNGNTAGNPPSPRPTAYVHAARTGALEACANAPRGEAHQTDTELGANRIDCTAAVVTSR